MRFLVITIAPTIYKGNNYFSYAPYVKEMNLWFSQVDEINVLSPSTYSQNLLLAPFFRKDIKTESVPNLNFESIYTTFRSILFTPVIIFKMFIAMQKADHIHLRCPGNLALLGCLVQIFFPKKTKTAKYAGNWDPNSKQPLSYRIQKWLLSNTFLTRNMQVLVYGDWPNQSNNIKPFFTATYPKEKTPPIRSRGFKAPFRFLYVGSLVSGKRPIYAIQLVQKLIKKGIDCRLDLYGEGAERIKLENYIEDNQLSGSIKLHGNQKENVLVDVYKNSDFLLLPSQSEGWPKVVAEAMFWGVIPIASKVSCVPWMLEKGKRGALLETILEEDIIIIENLLLHLGELANMVKKAQEWSHQYSVDDFEKEIKKLI